MRNWTDEQIEVLKGEADYLERKKGFSCWELVAYRVSVVKHAKPKTPSACRKAWGRMQRPKAETLLVCGDLVKLDADGNFGKAATHQSDLFSGNGTAEKLDAIIRELRQVKGILAEMKARS